MRKLQSSETAYQSARSYRYMMGICLFATQVLATIASSFLCLSAGLTNGISAVLLPMLVSDSTLSWGPGFGPWIAAIAPISSILGCICVGTLLDGYGRRTVHIILAFPFIAGWMFMAFADDFPTMMVGRCLTGLSYGAVRPATIIYLGEISDPKYRGIILLCPSLALNIGVLLSHVIGSFIYWRTTLLICVAPSAMMFALLFFLKESPYWLIAQGRVDEGVECFRWFRGSEATAESELQNVVEKQKGITSRFSVKEVLETFCSSAFIKPTVTVVFIFLAVQMCGINAFPFYAYDLLKTMFGTTGESHIATFFLMVAVDLIRVAVSIVICLFGRKMRRKLVFVVAAYGTTVILAGLVICGFYQKLYALPLILLVLYTCAASAIASLGWTFIAELYPTKVRGLGSSLSGVICFILLSICIKMTPDLLWSGGSVMYGTFACLTGLSAVVLTFILPETNGRRLQDIEDSYDKRDKDIIVTAL
ncbi:facilitated trehalose transporter Tret1-like isoform X2 [Leguminivora glycinivorella]|uniref:facilitated trehalose transporter Tret1-like isoform X2 n=1 Tax=Leguminivora glycinivorella TaxID=1035111 RepID=UPI00200FE075|nr:facilitated trehalose transporter Tret1-like isoform X2 [Leguminivora glycinivorella]